MRHRCSYGYMYSSFRGDPRREIREIPVIALKVSDRSSITPFHGCGGGADCPLLKTPMDNAASLSQQTRLKRNLPSERLRVAARCVSCACNDSQLNERHCTVLLLFLLRFMRAKVLHARHIWSACLPS